MHGAEYIGDSRAGSAYMGRSFGCPAVPQAQSQKIINMLKNGTCLFIYHPTQKYLNASQILNAWFGRKQRWMTKPAVPYGWAFVFMSHKQPRNYLCKRTEEQTCIYFKGSMVRIN